MGRAGALLGVAAIAIGVAACGSSSSGGTSGGAPAPSSSGSGSTFQLISTNEAGTPVKGGILNVLGTADVDFLDPNITYFTNGYIVMREWSRQLYTYPAVEGKQTTVVPDLATAMPQVSNGNKTFTVTIQKGATWDTSPARQITGADEVRGVEVTCNPAEPWGGLPDIEGLIVGMQSFCTGFAKVPQTATAIANYMNTHSISGITVSKSNPEQVTFNLTHPAGYFAYILAIPAMSPRPVEMNKYVPASAQEAQNTISDGPYKVSLYNPAHELDFVRNPEWNSSTDNVRHAYVDQIKINMTGQQNTIQEQLQTNTPSADIDYDVGPTAQQAVQLIQSHDPNLNVQSVAGTDPYLVFNTHSPNNNGAMAKVAIRQALSYGLQRTNFIQDLGGPDLNPPLTHVLPPLIQGSPPAKDYYPYNQAKAKQLLAANGGSNLTLTFLYPSDNQTWKQVAVDAQAQLQQIGVTVHLRGVPGADFFTQYLEKPTTNADKGVWDIAVTGWFPDWYGNAAQSFFGPLFDGRTFPPNSSNFGLYNNPTVNSEIDKANAATSTAQANADWAAADDQVMKDAAIFPITSPNYDVYHASQVHNTIFLPSTSQFDYTNVWLDPSKNGD